MINNKIAVFAIETTKKTSQQDIEDFTRLMDLIDKKYNFKWCRTLNSKWVRALADEMESREEKENE